MPKLNQKRSFATWSLTSLPEQPLGGPENLPQTPGWAIPVTMLDIVEVTAQRSSVPV